MFLISLFSCQGDIGLIYYDKRQDDTSVVDELQDTSYEDTVYPEDTSSPSGVSGYFNYQLQQIACPPCFGLNREITVSFSGFFHEGITDSHFDGSLEPNTCTTSDIYYRPSYNILPHSSAVSLSSSNYSFNIPSVNSEYFYDLIYENQYERDSLYEVQTESGSFTFQSIHGFDSIEPYDMFYVDPSYAFATPIYKSGQQFSWYPNGSDSEFEISLQIFNQTGTQLLGVVTCAGYDSGFMTIPSNYLMSYPQNSLVAVILTRHKRDLSLYEPLNSFIETDMTWQVIGTGFIY